jgi:transcriptional regulator with XRE-family HTH domain
MTHTALAVRSPSVEIDRDVLRETRQLSGFTQVELARRARISNQYVSQLENGYRTHVSPPTFVRLCDALLIRPQGRRKLLKSGQADA